ncbi:hypothetical protein, partial [Pseudomonas viridiflava]|uniref:hypothetical protein n=1 Tax=Pseudomonas viridiflava TaxID=33069 RepID=UPI001980F8AF
ELRRASELAVPNFPNGTKIVSVDMTQQAGLKGITGTPDQWVVPNLDAIADQFNIYSNSGTFAVAPRANNVRSVDEEDRGGYLMGEFSTDLGSIPFSGNFGVRYVKTKQSSTGLSTLATGTVSTTVDRSYDDT